MISYCGIDCSKCESYLATQANSDIERRKIAEQCLIEFNVNMKPEEINCNGCKSNGVKCAFAASLCEIRKCNIEKSQPYCAVCSEYKCEKLEKIIQSAPAICEALEAIRQNLRNQMKQRKWEKGVTPILFDTAPYSGESTAKTYSRIKMTGVIISNGPEN